MISSALTYLAAGLAVLLGAAAVFRKPRVLASWCFLGGMCALGAETVMAHLVESSSDVIEAEKRLTYSMLIASFLPAVWLCFSLTYCRGNAREFLSRWRLALAGALVLPPVIAFSFRSDLVEAVLLDASSTWMIEVGGQAQFLSVLILLASLLILMNLEKTFRASVGTTRWRMKYLFMGVALVFGTRIYTISQTLLFHAFNPAIATLESGALLIGSVLMAIGYFRRGLEDLELYPSRSVLEGSLTVVLAGIYLVVVGVFAQAVTLLGGRASFQAQAFLVLLGVAGLGVLLLSDRFRTRVQHIVTRHFQRPQHNFRDVWQRFTDRTFEALDREGLSRASAELISETLDAKTVYVFLASDDQKTLALEASTFKGGVRGEHHSGRGRAGSDVVEGLRTRLDQFDLDENNEPWAEKLKQLSATQFSRGGHRFALPLATRGQFLGVVVLADRLGGRAYSHEERDLLSCISDQIAAALLNRRLTETVMDAKELDAFQTISTFFIHDLKNAANSLALMLQNVPAHFDDPEFRKDAFRVIGKSVDRINHLIERLSAIRKRPLFEPVDLELGPFVDQVLEDLNGTLDGVELIRESTVGPTVRVDREQMQSVVTNLLINAREAVGAGGRIELTTGEEDGQAVLLVKDNGCGMSPEFIRDSLFRPFRSTKSKGLGIGIFQSKLIVEAHHGGIHVVSKPDEGTTFRVVLPAAQKSES